MTQNEYEELERGDKVYFARVLPPLGYYEIHEVVMINKNDEYCTATEQKTKQTFLFMLKDVTERLYIDRSEALKYLKEQKVKNKDVVVYTDKE